MRDDEMRESEKIFKGRTSMVKIKNDLVIKSYRSKTTRRNLKKEYLILRVLENWKIAPKPIEFKNDKLIMKYIKGKPLKFYYKTKEFPKIFMLLVIRSAILDLLRINHNQLEYGKNIIVDEKNVPWFVDFEKSSIFSKTVGKNLGQIIGFYSKFLNIDNKEVLFNLVLEWKNLLKKLYKINNKNR